MAIIKKIDKKIAFLLAYFFVLIPCAFSKNMNIGLSSFFTAGIGTEYKDAQLNAEISAAKEAGFDANFLWHYNFAVNAFFAYRLPIFPKVSFQADFSYINFNGFSVKIDSFSYCYSYKSIELAPLAKFCDSFRIVNYSLFAGPNFSFPIGKIEYAFNNSSDSTHFFTIKTFSSLGAIIGASFGIKMNNFNFFIAARYLFDFFPLVYEIENSEEELMIRRVFLIGLGIEYSF